VSGDSSPSSRNPERPHANLHAKRRLAHISRWLHTYLSMFSFAILLFFAVTGFTLNHADWFDNQQRSTQSHGTLDKAWVKTSDPQAVAKMEIVEYLRRTNGISGALSDFRVDEGQCEITFKGAGYEADAVVDRETGAYDLTVMRFGLVAIVNDLHKGRDTGPGWSRVIDFSAILMTLVSVTGLTLIFFLTKRRFSGLALLAIGAAATTIFYFVWVR